MDNTQKMLQAIINGQSALKQELVREIKKVDRKVDNVHSELQTLRKDITKRVDQIGKSLAYLEDDTPTREEFDNLEDRVDKIENKPTPVL